MTRDNFSDITKLRLALNVRFMCVYPPCQKATHGPSLSGDTLINIGNAAHITAASTNGPRYDASLTPEQRRAYENGAWLCATHATLVDRAPEDFPPSVLQGWQRSAEARARNDVYGVSTAATTTQPEISSALAKFIPLAGKAIEFRMTTFFFAGFQVPKESVNAMQRLIRECSGYHWHPGHPCHSGNHVTLSKQDYVISTIRQMIDLLSDKNRWVSDHTGYSVAYASESHMNAAFESLKKAYGEVDSTLHELRQYMRGQPNYSAY